MSEKDKVSSAQRELQLVAQCERDHALAAEWQATAERSRIEATELRTRCDAQAAVLDRVRAELGETDDHYYEMDPNDPPRRLQAIHLTLAAAPEHTAPSTDRDLVLAWREQGDARLAAERALAAANAHADAAELENEKRAQQDAGLREVWRNALDDAERLLARTQDTRSKTPRESNSDQVQLAHEIGQYLESRGWRWDAINLGWSRP